MNRRDVLRSGTVATTGIGIGALTAAPAGAAPRPPRGPLRVHTVLYDGVEEQDFAGPVETFGIVADNGRPVRQSFVTADGPRTITTAAGIDIAVRTPWSPRSADIIVVPGGGLGPGSAVTEEIRRGVLPRALSEAQRPGLITASVCSGALLLAAAKITTGRPCTTHHAAVEDLEAQGGKVIKARVVDDGDLVTSGGVTSGIDLALWLIERLYGPESALFAEQVLEYERRGTVWRSRWPREKGIEAPASIPFGWFVSGRHGDAAGGQRLRTHRQGLDRRERGRGLGVGVQRRMGEIGEPRLHDGPLGGPVQPRVGEMERAGRCAHCQRPFLRPVGPRLCGRHRLSHTPRYVSESDLVRHVFPMSPKSQGQRYAGGLTFSNLYSS